MTAVIRSQWILLDRARMWLVAGAIMVVFTVVTTGLSIAAAEPAGQGLREGLTIESLSGPGGATAAVNSALSFGSILILVTFIAAMANEFTRGTFRAALLQRPGRLSFFAGKTVALLGVTVIFVLGALVVGVITAAIVAPGQGVDTSGWFGADALVDAAGDVLRLLGWTFGWAVLGTTIGVVCRSTPVGLGLGILWFGPIENILGDSQDFAVRWFPGQLLRSVVSPDNPLSVRTSTAVATLAVYLAVCVAVVAITVRRRDVTA